jgi:hypothetical protein
MKRPSAPRPGISTLERKRSQHSRRLSGFRSGRHGPNRSLTRLPFVRYSIISHLQRDNLESTILLLPAMTAILSLGPGPKDLSRQILEHQAPEYTFTFTPFLFQTYRHGLSPNRPTCKAYLQGHCPLGPACPDKHTTANSNSNFNNLVCKHWLRGLCKKGESCEFLHEYNLRKMPECNFFVRNGYCSNGGTYCLPSSPVVGALC